MMFYRTMVFSSILSFDMGIGNSYFLNIFVENKE